MAGKRSFIDESPAGWKTCTSCRNEKPLSHFYRHRLSPDGHQYICKACVAERAHKKPRQREHNRKHRLFRNGLTQEQYDEMLAAQDGCCAICGTTEPGNRYRFFPIDHNHETGRNRGLLCDDCNNGLGRFKDNPYLLRAAIAYLSRTA